jgi:2'-5' RNA ligase
MARRLFFALWPSPGLQRDIAASAATLIRNAGVTGRPARTEGLHLTLLFLGQVAPEAEPALYEAASGAAAPGFSLRLDRLDSFAKARVLWLGCREVPLALGLLARQLRERVAAAGIEFDRKPLVPHVTVMRDIDRIPPPAALAPLAWAVDGFALVESTAASRYHVVSHWPAQDGAADLH